VLLLSFGGAWIDFSERDDQQHRSIRVAILWVVSKVARKQFGEDAVLDIALWQAV
jgi:hypothetical protein